MVLLILPIFLQVATPSPALACFPDGPVEGMCADAILYKNGDLEVWSLKPAITPGVPFPAKPARVVSRLVQTYESREAAFPRKLLAARVRAR